MNKLRYKDGKGDPRGFKSFLDSEDLTRGFITRYSGDRLHVILHICGKYVDQLWHLCQVSQEWYRIWWPQSSNSAWFWYGHCQTWDASTVEPLLYDHPLESDWGGHIRGMVVREGFVYEQKPLSVTRNVVVWEGWSLVRVVVRQGFYCTGLVWQVADWSVDTDVLYISWVGHKSCWWYQHHQESHCCSQGPHARSCLEHRVISLEEILIAIVTEHCDSFCSRHPIWRTFQGWWSRWCLLQSLSWIGRTRTTLALTCLRDWPRKLGQPDTTTWLFSALRKKSPHATICYMSCKMRADKNWWILIQNGRTEMRRSNPVWNTMHPERKAAEKSA